MKNKLICHFKFRYKRVRNHSISICSDPREFGVGGAIPSRMNPHRRSTICMVEFLKWLVSCWKEAPKNIIFSTLSPLMTTLHARHLNIFLVVKIGSNN